MIVAMVIFCCCRTETASACQRLQQNHLVTRAKTEPDVNPGGRNLQRYAGVIGYRMPTVEAAKKNHVGLGARPPRSWMSVRSINSDSSFICRSSMTLSASSVA